MAINMLEKQLSCKYYFSREQDYGGRARDLRSSGPSALVVEDYAALLVLPGYGGRVLPQGHLPLSRQ